MVKSFLFFESRTAREVLILCDDGRLLLNRVPPDFGVVGLSESDLAHGESITAAFTQQPRQGRRQLRIDNEFSRQPKDRMVGLSRGVDNAHDRANSPSPLRWFVPLWPEIMRRIGLGDRLIEVS